MNTQLINTCDIDFPVAHSCPPADAVDLFAYVHAEMRNSAAIESLPVRYDSGRGKYLIVEDHAANRCACLTLQAARKLGLSTLPCRVIDDAPPAGPESIAPPLPVPPVCSPTSQVPATNDSVWSADQFNSLFRDLVAEFSRMAAGRCKKMRRSALRIADADDWLQAAFMALWRELRRQQPRLKTVTDVKRFVYGVFRNQAARAMQVGHRTVTLTEDVMDQGQGTLDVVLAEEAKQSLDDVEKAFQKLIERAEAALEYVLAGLPDDERRAAEVWLAGAGLRPAATKAGVSLAVVRRVTDGLRFAPSPLKQIMDELRREFAELYRERPDAAANLWPHRLSRLLEVRDQCSGREIRSLGAQMGGQ